MNKRRLLLFSVFALLHLTTSERSFIDGRCSDQPLRFVSSDTRFSIYETHQVQRLPEIGQLIKREKYPNCNERVTELTYLSRRRQIGFTKGGSRDSEFRVIVERHEKRILTNSAEEIHERRDFRERIREGRNALRNDFRRNRFSTHRDRQYKRNFKIPSLSRNGDRINDVTRNRLENGDVNRHNYINRDAYIRNIRDKRNEVRREAPELFERNTERYTVRNDFDHIKYFQINRRLARSENSKLKLQEPSRLQREYTDNKYERATKRQSERNYNLDGIYVSREKENRISIRSRSSEEKYPSQDRRNYARLQFDKRNLNDNMRYNRGPNEREIPEKREERINIRLDRNHAYISSRGFMERNIFESRLSNKIRRSKSSDDRDINENRLSVRHSHIERALERENERTNRRNLQTKEFRVRDAVKSERVQRNINDASDRLRKRNREALSYSPEIRERHDSRRNIRESRYDRSIENRVIIERGDQQSDKRHETINKRIRNNNVEHRFAKQITLTIRQDQNRIALKTYRNVIAVRNSVQIPRKNIKDEFRHRSLNLSNDKRLTGSREDTRKTDDERRKTQERFINIQRTAVVINERRESMMEFSDSKRSMIIHKIKYENQVFEMKWQYLFYALQLVYLCSILMKIPKENEGNKHKRFADWFTSAQYIKID